MSREIKNLMSNVLNKSNENLMLLKTREDVINKYLHFDFNKEYDTKEQRLEAFFDSIEILKSFARRWENEKHGFVCCVDRVYQYYLRPLFKKFNDVGFRKSAFMKVRASNFEEL